MAIRTRSTGEGFSRRSRLALFDSKNTDDDHRDTIAAWNERRRWTLEGQLQPIEQLAREIADRPNAKVPAYSFDYADNALRIIGLIRRAVGENDAEVAARWALELGAIWSEFQLKLGFEKAAMGPSKGGKRAAETRWSNEASKARDAQIKAAFGDEQSRGLSKMDAYREVARKLHIGRRTVERVIANSG